MQSCEPCLEPAADALRRMRSAVLLLAVPVPHLGKGMCLVFLEDVLGYVEVFFLTVGPFVSLPLEQLRPSVAGSS